MPDGWSYGPVVPLPLEMYRLTPLSLSARRYGSCSSHAELVGGPHMAFASNPPASLMAYATACGIPSAVVVSMPDSDAAKSKNPWLRAARNMADVPPMD